MTSVWIVTWHDPIGYTVVCGAADSDAAGKQVAEDFVGDIELPLTKWENLSLACAAQIPNAIPSWRMSFGAEGEMRVDRWEVASSGRIDASDSER